MATPPDFTAGTALAASSMNAIGLWLVKEQTVGSGVSSVTVTGAFTADFDRYKITYVDGVSSTSTNLRLRMGATTSPYYINIIFSDYGGSVVAANSESNTQTSWNWCGHIAPTRSICDIDLMAPNLAKITFVHALFDNGTSVGRAQGSLGTTTEYTEFTLFPSSGTITGGTIRVYGYRN